MSQQVIGIASDHGGRVLKNTISQYLIAEGYQIEDFGVPVDADASVDYPDLAAKVAAPISKGDLGRGILVCGTGIGMSIAANRYPGVRAALVWNEFTATACREHNEANILCLGERVLNHDRALDLVKIWLQLEQKAEARHQVRINKIENLTK